MKKMLSYAVLLLILPISQFAQASEVPAPCIVLKDEIAGKIVRNGVAATDFRLDIVTQKTELSEGKVVGNCGFGSHKIIYIRGKGINPQGSISEEKMIESPQIEVAPAGTPEPEQPSVQGSDESSAEAVRQTESDSSAENERQPTLPSMEGNTTGESALTVTQSGGAVRITNSDNSIIIHR